MLSLSAPRGSPMGSPLHVNTLPPCQAGTKPPKHSKPRLIAVLATKLQPRAPSSGHTLSIPCCLDPLVPEINSAQVPEGPSFHPCWDPFPPKFCTSQNPNGPVHLRPLVHTGQPFWEKLSCQPCSSAISAARGSVHRAMSSSD